jgi:hypothetical protein
MADCNDCYRIGTQCDYHFTNGGGPYRRYRADDLDDDLDSQDAVGGDDGPDRDEYEPPGSYFDQEDTPSLQDTDPEGHRYITNNYGHGY